MSALRSVENALRVARKRGRPVAALEGVLAVLDVAQEALADHEAAA